MDRLRTLKKAGNDQYLEQDFEASCVTYGKVLNEMMSMEQQSEAPLGSEFDKLKSVLFSNLAAANLKLHDYEAVRRCCNASIVFINEPTLPMLDLGLEDRNDDNVLDNTSLKEPVADDCCSRAAKILYRRAYALNKMASTPEALNAVHEGLVRAHSLLPTDKQIQVLSGEVLKRMSAVSTGKAKRAAEAEDSQKGRFFKVEINPEKEGLIVNGGPCLKRKGHWSQSVESATVFLPLTHFLCTLEELSDRGATICGIDGSMTIAVKESVSKAELTVTMERGGVYIDTGPSGETDVPQRHYLPLEYFIDPSTSTWQLDSLYNQDNLVDENSTSAHSSSLRTLGSLPPSHLVLHLSKVSSVEWFPGCEWWTAVFVGDEAIDTASCTVGTDTRQLPDSAVARAEREHRRFVELGETEKREELEEIMRMKRETVEAVEGEERALQRALAQYPERAEMLGALSAEFPGVFFSANTDAGAGGATTRK